MDNQCEGIDRRKAGQVSWHEVARTQGGVVSTTQLASLGLTTSAVRCRVDRGDLVRVARGLYLAGGAPMTTRSRLWAAVLLTAGVLVRSHAGRLWGVWSAPDRDPRVGVAIAHDRRVRGVPDWVRLHRTAVPRHEVRERSGLPVTSRSWTVFDLIASLPRSEGATLADRALQRGWIRPEDCARRLAEHPGRHGNSRLRELAARLGDGAAAESERVLHRVLRDAGITDWRPNHAVWAHGELVAVVDVAIPARRIAIEVDGMAFHVDAERFQHDRSRQNQLVALGWTVLRFTWNDLIERPGYVVATIRRFVG